MRLSYDAGRTFVLCNLFGSASALGVQGLAEEPVFVTIRMALAHLQVDSPHVQPAPFSAFFQRRDVSAAFVVPPSEKYIHELHACWTDARAFSRLTTDGRASAAVQEASRFGLGQMPVVVPGIASLIIPPDEAMRHLTPHAFHEWGPMDPW
ncbi:hypothetical protein GOODEAATRI_028105 [Goodea atripinnis]|uniref:Uncharacterized protein n=1 Tax=Goodea atripinnis TaxID=208336 RepID=A0ABV0NEJ7_9TELE